MNKLNSLLKNKVLLLKAVIVIVYIVGLIGFLTPSLKPLFIQLIPVNLLFAIGILFYNHKAWTKDFWVVASFVFLLGMIVEIVGVQTGLIFGDYEYGSVLGLQILGVPLLIGVNWLFLVYCIGTYFQNKNINFFIKILASVLLLIFYDFFLETVAINTGMWIWTTPHPPLQNFIGWGITSGIMFYLWYSKRFNFENKYAAILYIVQLIFFVILNLKSI
jgi:putative membrane protein